MKVLVICFSQTGNTEKIANRIRKGIVDDGHSCDLSFLKTTNQQKLKDYDLIGIGTPTFFYREPVNVKHFIAHMEAVDEKHCFLFCTHGSIIGNTFYYMQKGLRQKGYIVIETFDTYADSSLQFYPVPMHTAGHPDDVELAQALRFGADICRLSSKIHDKTADPIPPIEPVEDTWWAKAAKTLTPEYLREFFPKLTINKNKCTSCSLCQENCPTDAIDIEANPPEIQKEGCIFCLYCEKSCPEGAIQADWEIAKKITRGNLAKYVTELKEAEKQGKFRPYVDYTKII